jgi:dephospho-CoA kinase
MRRIGLTGGIASGKSTVCRMLGEKGCTIIDADAVAHLLIRRGNACYEPVVQAFGREVLDGTGEIERAKLGTLVFGNPLRLLQLTTILHPQVARQILSQLDSLLNQDSQARVIVDASVMVESGFHRDFQFLIVVSCTLEQQIQRLMARSGLTEAAARQRIELQIPLAEKIPLADFVIDNSGSLDNMRFQVDLLLDHLGWKPLNTGMRTA